MRHAGCTRHLGASAGMDLPDWIARLGTPPFVAFALGFLACGLVAVVGFRVGYLRKGRSRSPVKNSNALQYQRATYRRHQRAALSLGRTRRRLRWRPVAMPAALALAGLLILFGFWSREASSAVTVRRGTDPVLAHPALEGF